MIRIPLVSEEYLNGVDAFDKWIFPRVDETERTLVQSGMDAESARPGDFPVVYDQLRSAVLMHEAGGMDEQVRPDAVQRLEIASECLDHLGELSMIYRIGTYKLSFS